MMNASTQGTSPTDNTTTSSNTANLVAATNPDTLASMVSKTLGDSTEPATNTAMADDMPKSDVNPATNPVPSFNPAPSLNHSSNSNDLNLPIGDKAAADSIPAAPANPSASDTGNHGSVPPHFVPSSGNLVTPPDDESGLKAPTKKKNVLIPALAGLAMLLAVVGGGAALYLSQQQQDLRQKAAEDKNITCTGVELRKFETGQNENDPSTWTRMTGSSATVKEGTKIAYIPTGCTQGWMPGIRYTYDNSPDGTKFDTSGASTWCASNYQYCKWPQLTTIYDANKPKIYIRINLKKTIDSKNYWCKHDNTWATSISEENDPPLENSNPPSADYTCNTRAAWAEITVEKNTTSDNSCYTTRDSCSSRNSGNCTDPDTAAPDLDTCINKGAMVACNISDKSNSDEMNYVVVSPLNFDARGKLIKENDKIFYVGSFRAYRSSPAIKGFTYSALTFFCPEGPTSSTGACNLQQQNIAPTTVSFNDQNSVIFDIRRETSQCGAFQIDPYFSSISINGSAVSCANKVTGSTYAVCNNSSNQNAQLCPGWEAVCKPCPNCSTTPSPTPTPGSCPTSAHIKLNSINLTKNTQGKIVVSWTAPSPVPNPTESYIINRVVRPITDATPTPTWSPVQAVIGPRPASDAKFVKSGTTISYTDTANTATCGFVYHYFVRAYNTTSADAGKDTACNVLAQEELYIPCEGTQTPTPTGQLTSTPTPTGQLTSTPTPTGQLTSTPTPTTTAYGCNKACSDDSQCKTVNSNYVCSIEHGNVCRLEGNRGNTDCETPGATNTPTPTAAIGCNDSCVTNADCANPAHICYQTNTGAKVCRLDSNPDSVSCSPAYAQAQPTLPPSLPQTGPEDWALWLKAGLVTLGLGAALLLLL